MGEFNPAEYVTDKTSLKADREDWGEVPLKPSQNIGKTNAGRTIGSGGPEGPRKPTKPFKSFEKQRKAY